MVQAPLALDAVGSYILVAYAPLELTLLRVAMIGALSPNAASSAKIHVVRELSIMSVGQPITVRARKCPKLHHAIHAAVSPLVLLIVCACNALVPAMGHSHAQVKCPYFT